MHRYSLWLISLLVLSACGQHAGDFDETKEGFFVAAAIDGVDTSKLSSADQDLYHHAGLSMLVEQYTVQNLSTMRSAIRANPPAGVVFWNSSRVGAPELAAVTQAYAKEAKTAARSQPPLLFSTDYEGGGLSKAISGKTVPGVQRFTKGFTNLPHGQWLGDEIDKLGTTRLCELQGEIMGKELMAVGINYPLATISDLAGGLFVNRGISKNPETIAKCLEKLTESFHRASGNNAIFVTKHFPGLGFTHGDTHEITVTSDRRGREFEQNLLPFKRVAQKHREWKKDHLLSIMVAHAQFTAYSPDRTSTESSTILNDVLKGSGSFVEKDQKEKYIVKGVGLNGFALSDAMWMGVYGYVHKMATLGKIDDDDSGKKLKALKSFLTSNGFYSEKQVNSLSQDDYQRVYNVLCLNAIISGMDILMVPNVQFARLVGFFRAGVVDKWSAEDKRVLTVRTGLSSAGVRAALRSRLAEIILLNRTIRSRLTPAVPFSGVLPRNENIVFAQEMLQTLRYLDSTWN